MRQSPDAAGWWRRAATLRRYILFQMPGFVLATVAAVSLYRWIGFPAWAAVTLVLFWIAKDFALYRLLRASYEVDTRMPNELLIGKRGVATEALAPLGYVRLRGELWRAEVADLDRGIDAGATVEVVGASGLTLVVREAPPGLPG